jgi:hypothetical protein
LESYQAHILPQKNSKIQKLVAFIIAYSKLQKAILTSLEL